MEISAHSVVFGIGLGLVLCCFLREIKISRIVHRYGLIAGAFLLRLSTCLDPFLHEWDERYHALVAKNLQFSWLKPVLYPKTPLPYDYTDWQLNAVWLHKQPVALWLISGTIRLFGCNEFAVRIPSLVLSTLAVYLTYQIGTWLFSPKVGFWAAFFHAINGLLIEMTGGRSATDHVDVIFFCLIELGIFLSVLSGRSADLSDRKKTLLRLLVGAVTGLAILCKWLPALIILLLYGLLHYKQRRFVPHFALVLTATLVIALPWQIYAAVQYPHEYWYELAFNSRHFFEILEGHDHSLWFFFNQARINWNDLVYVPIVWLLYYLVKNERKSGNFILLATWIFVPYLVFTIARTKLQAYVLFTGPAIFIVSSYFFVSVVDTWQRPLRIILTTLFILFAVRYAVERVKPLDTFEQEKRSSAFIKGLDEFAKTNCNHKKTVIFNAPQYIEIMFYTNHLAYKMNPSIAEAQTVTDQNYAIVVLGDNVPKTILDMPNVHIYREPNPENER